MTESENPMMHDVYLLFDRELPVEGSVITNGRLSSEALDVVKTRVESNGGLRYTSLEELAVGQVQPMGHDGTIFYTCVGTPKGNFSIRFKCKKS